MSDVLVMVSNGTPAAEIFKKVGVEGIITAAPALSRTADGSLAGHDLLELCWDSVRGATHNPARQCEVLSLWAEVLKTLEEEECYAEKIGDMITILCGSKDFDGAARAYFRLPHPRCEFLPPLQEEDYDAFIHSIERVGMANGTSCTQDVAHVMLHRLVQHDDAVLKSKPHIEMIMSIYERAQRRGSMGKPSSQEGPSISVPSPKARGLSKLSTLLPVICVPTPHVLAEAGSSRKEPIRTIAATPSTVLAGCMDATLRVVDLATGRLIGQHRDYTAGVSCVKVIEATKAVTSSYDGIVRILDFDNPSRTTMTLKGHTDLVRQVAVNPENLNVIASCSTDETVRVWDLRKAAEPVSILKHEDPVISVAFANPYIMTGSTDGVLCGWEADVLTKRVDLHNGILVIHAEEETATGTALVGCQNGAMYNVVTGRETASPVLTFHLEDVSAILTSPNAPGMVITGSSDDCIRMCLHDKCAAVIAGHTGGGVSALALAADDGTRTVFVSSGGDGDVRVWGYDLVRQIP
eukprot:PhM_4_TR16068/c0_g1_i1/m.39238